MRRENRIHGWFCIDFCISNSFSELPKQKWINRGTQWKPFTNKSTERNNICTTCSTSKCKTCRLKSTKKSSKKTKGNKNKQNNNKFDNDYIYDIFYDDTVSEFSDDFDIYNEEISKPHKIEPVKQMEQNDDYQIDEFDQKSSINNKRMIDRKMKKKSLKKKIKNNATTENCEIEKIFKSPYMRKNKKQTIFVSADDSTDYFSSDVISSDIEYLY